MAYLTFDEYSAFGFAELDEAEFDKLYPRAEMTLMTATRRFYMRHDFSKDNTMRVTVFKQALALQIEYQFKTGFVTAEEKLLNSKIQSQTIGRTSLSFGSSGSNSGNSASLLSADAEQALQGTGLLYAGVHYAR